MKDHYNIIEAGMATRNTDRNEPRTHKRLTGWLGRGLLKGEKESNRYGALWVIPRREVEIATVLICAHEADMRALGKVIPKLLRDNKMWVPGEPVSFELAGGVTAGTFKFMRLIDKPKYARMTFYPKPLLEI